MNNDIAPPRFRLPTGAMIISVVLLLMGLIPTTGGGSWRAGLRSLHTLEPNRAERAARSAGYYAGLIDGPTTGRDELSLTLLGKPPGWIHFTDIDAARFLRGDFLQFELKPNIDTSVLGNRFTTNAQGLRDRAYTIEKPPGVFRVVLLGSSIDMGWGVGTDETYENRLEDWLNAHAAKRGIARRFEILNLAMAAYSPLHRLEAFARKAAEFQPDMVFYASTRLDTRLAQIHLVGLLQDHTDLKYDFVRDFVCKAAIDRDQLALDEKGKLRDKERIKSALEPWLWSINDEAVAHLATLCRSANLPVTCLIIPRASEEDTSELRGDDVLHISRLARKHGLVVLDLSNAFDEEDQEAIEMAPWDDHPNVFGHELLFLELGRKIVANTGLYQALFGIAPVEDKPAGTGKSH